MAKTIRLGERVLTIHDAPFEGDAFEYFMLYETILNKSGGGCSIESIEMLTAVAWNRIPEDFGK